MNTFISLKSILASFLVIATVVYGQCGGSNTSITSDDKFKFFKEPFYKELFKVVNPSPYKCVTVGKFASASFKVSRGGVVTMYEHSGCSGVSKDRVIPQSSQPGHNIKDYGILFRSIRYTPSP
ncbi:hypothetical protein AYI70_g8801 [Smittium culicis]|uniref:Uncharacterized protein n=1 Tax=Smittium culicis TaxID=133412 RepID=A0A1R1WXR5_9FUNG|nr:hypothetical protein AYI70_g12365 [Smittium culicis]OMJ12958.1 hypothetical protein AYI70_g8801 [Smittium culicis]